MNGSVYGSRKGAFNLVKLCCLFGEDLPVKNI